MTISIVMVSFGSSSDPSDPKPYSLAIGEGFTAKVIWNEATSFEEMTAITKWLDDCGIGYSYKDSVYTFRSDHDLATFMMFWR